ncbi:hypothetical protein [Paenibacillus sp. S28]|uniref:hypothetical protein n=1 Tax=Paenibacillus sp. S28 TaxID=2767463 RepID=UPI00190E146E|nr:hypothetical protein [Paenibacillus sp. S28]MBJ9989303.1 hypothetical protein [Paenibacillus sp. S28]
MAHIFSDCSERDGIDPQEATAFAFVSEFQPLFKSDRSRNLETTAIGGTIRNCSGCLAGDEGIFEC